MRLKHIMDIFFYSELCVVCIAVVSNLVLSHYLAHWEHLQVEQEWPKNWALRHSAYHGCPINDILHLNYEIKSQIMTKEIW